MLHAACCMLHVASLAALGRLAEVDVSGCAEITADGVLQLALGCPQVRAGGSAEVPRHGGCWLGLDPPHRVRTMSTRCAVDVCNKLQRATHDMRRAAEQCPRVPAR